MPDAILSGALSTAQSSLLHGGEARCIDAKQLRNIADQSTLDLTARDTVCGPEEMKSSSYPFGVAGRMRRPNEDHRQHTK